MAQPTFFGEGSTPRVHDTRWRILQKILGVLISGGGGGGGGVGTDYNLEYATPAALPAAPADTTKVWTVGFVDGSPNMRWSVSLQAWV